VLKYAEFRDHKDLTDPEKIQFRVGLALHGLKTMHKYVNMNEDDEGNLQITLEQDPLGEAAFRKREAQKEKEKVSAQQDAEERAMKGGESGSAAAADESDSDEEDEDWGQDLKARVATRHPKMGRGQSSFLR